MQLKEELNSVRMELKDKELLYKELERQSQLRQKELSLALERAEEETRLRVVELRQKQEVWERERKSLSEGGAGKKMIANLQREQQVMSAVFHRLGFEHFKE